MRLFLLKWLRLSAVIGVILLCGSVTVGCQKDGQLSNRDLQELKQGPPKEMPPEARAEMEKARQGNSGTQPANK